mmetsp:Transcript_1930/g.5339  ORF Transcript_1930/g.5339 Transcript_1930/m.5339 type:complete len:403 (-) Transcript_1930:456-1664(-)
MKRKGNVGTHGGAGHLGHGGGIKDEEERVLVGRVEYDGDKYSVILRISLGAGNEDGFHREEARRPVPRVPVPYDSGPIRNINLVDTGVDFPLAGLPPDTVDIPVFPQVVARVDPGELDGSLRHGAHGDLVRGLPAQGVGEDNLLEGSIVEVPTPSDVFQLEHPDDFVIRIRHQLYYDFAVLPLVTIYRMEAEECITRCCKNNFTTLTIHNINHCWLVGMPIHCTHKRLVVEETRETDPEGPDDEDEILGGHRTRMQVRERDVGKDAHHSRGLIGIVRNGKHLVRLTPQVRHEVPRLPPRLVVVRVRCCIHTALHTLDFEYLVKELHIPHRLHRLRVKLLHAGAIGAIVVPAPDFLHRDVHVAHKASVRCIRSIPHRKHRLETLEDRMARVLTELNRSSIVQR